MPLPMLLLLLLAAVTAVTGAEPLSPIRASHHSRHFFDESGRVRIFHGAARVQKNPPWYFSDLLVNDKEAVAMEALGFNVLRLGFMWSGYNPAPGIFNRTYIEVIKQTVSQLNAHGVYVLLDMHQDILSSKFCLYDGAPRWVIDKSQPRQGYPYPLGPPAPNDNNCTRTGSPHSPCNCTRSWSENALTVAAATAYQDIYDNNHGMLDDLAEFCA
jgi:endoglycosylceramidase